MLITIVVFILIVGLLVSVHELGHFIVAKLVGVKVEEFAFGFPPKIWSKKIGETKYILNVFPIGGYVKMLGEENSVNDKRSFSSQRTSRKIAVIIAGVVMNFVLAWIILTIGFSVGMSPLLSSPDQLGGKRLETSIIIAEVAKDSPADLVGLKPGDQIISIASDNQTVNIEKGNDLTEFTTSHQGQQISLTIDRDNEIKEFEPTLSDNQSQPLGVAAVDNSIIRIPWYKAPLVALIETGKVFQLTFNFIANLFSNMFTAGQIPSDIGGPVAIYVYTGMAVKVGIMAVLQFVAILSINLALVNILPIPALDGGKILFLTLRKIMGRRFIKEKVENIIHTVSFVLLILLMVLLTIKDIRRFF